MQNHPRSNRRDELDVTMPLLMLLGKAVAVAGTFLADQDLVSSWLPPLK